MKKSIVIGIGGASRAGKTSLAQKLKRRLKKQLDCAILHQDDYIKPISEIPMIRGEIDWEHPDSLDYVRFKELISEAKATHDVVIADGFLLYEDVELCALCDFHFFCTINKEKFMRRRRKDKRYGINTQWYIEHVWDSFLIFGQPPEGLKVYHECKPSRVMQILNL